MIVDASTSQMTLAVSASHYHYVNGNGSKVIDRVTVASSVAVKVVIQIGYQQAMVLFVRAGDTVDIPSLNLLVKQGESAMVMCTNIDRYAADVYVTTTTYDPRQAFDQHFTRQLEDELCKI